MKCTHCGKELLGSGTTCLYCGHEVKLLGGQQNSSIPAPSTLSAPSVQSHSHPGLLVGVLLAVLAVGCLGFLFRGQLATMYRSITHSAPDLDWELSEQLRKGEEEAMADFPYPVSSTDSGSIQITFEEDDSGSIQEMTVEGVYPKLSIYGLRTGMKLEELLQTAIQNDLLVIEHHPELLLEPADSSSLIRISFDPEQHSCKSWHFLKGDFIDPAKKQEQMQHCIELLQNVSFPSIPMTYKEMVEALSSIQGRWICSAALGRLQTGEDGWWMVSYQSEPDYSIWYIDPNDNLYFESAFLQDNLLESVEELETALAQAFSIDLAVGKQETTEKQEASSEQTQATDKDKPEPSRQDAILWSDGYILPYSDSMYYSAEDLEALSASDLRLARNEIYARHGRKFQDQQLQAYFDSCSWYDGFIEPEQFQEQTLNDYEMANRDLIKQCEENSSATSSGTTQASTSDINEILIGTWHNGGTDWATNYHTVFYADGSVEHFGYRNYDTGTWTHQSADSNEIVAYYDQYQDVEGEYVYSGSYTCYYYYNSSSGLLERNIIPGDYYNDFTNDGEGALRKVEEFVGNTH